MGWLSLVIDEWKSMGILDRIGWLFTVIWPLAMVRWGEWSMPVLSSWSLINFLLYLILIAFIVSGVIRRSKHRRDELEKLIKPLYLSLDSNRDNPIKAAHLAFSEIKQYGNLAQPELRKLLHQYCEIREENPNPEDRAPSYNWNHQKKLIDTIEQIFVLAEKRYKVLMWGYKER